MNKELLKDIIEWDIINWSKALKYWQPFVDKVKEKKDAKVLTLAERKGGLALWLGSQGVKNICSDYGAPYPIAHELHEKHGVKDLIEYADISIFEIPYPDNTFDLICCKSVIGGLKFDYNDTSTRTLDNQKKALDEILRVLKPGGVFLGAENMEGSWFHKMIRNSKGKQHGWRYLKPDELPYLFEGYSNVNLKYYGLAGTLWPVNAINNIAGAFDSVLSPIMPKSSKYISFIVATK